MELVAYRSLMEKEFELGFWRTEHGLEVDFIIGQGEVAIEVKISNAVRSEHLKSLRAFVAEHHPKRALVVSLDPRPRQLSHGIEIWPYQAFLQALWAGELL